MGNRLTAVSVRNAGTGKHFDKGSYGLYLRVRPSGSKGWFQRLNIRGRRHEMGLGSYPLVSLKDARKKALANRVLLSNGGDPLDDRRAASVPTVEEVAETVINLNAPTWKHSGKSAAQWRASLRDYVFPRLGRRPIDSIATADVLAVLVPIWNTKRETARRVRQRLSRIMQWAVAEGYRQDNPAGDAIGAALPKNEVSRQHHRALPYSEVASAIRMIGESGAFLSTKLCLEFLILTATRSGEARGARWDEVDFDAAVWTVPAERMKANKAQRVPLSDRAVAILREARGYGLHPELVFPSATGRVLTDNTLSKLVRELGIGRVPHGFRSCFGDWCGETGQPREAAEACLAHVIKDKTEAAYARCGLLERRREVMGAWAACLAGDVGNVVPFARRDAAGSR